MLVLQISLPQTYVFVRNNVRYTEYSVESVIMEDNVDGLHWIHSWFDNSEQCRLLAHSIAVSLLLNIFHLAFVTPLASYQMIDQEWYTCWTLSEGVHSHTLEKKLFKLESTYTIITVAMGQLQQSLITYIITGFDGNEELNKLAVE